MNHNDNPSRDELLLVECSSRYEIYYHRPDNATPWRLLVDEIDTLVEAKELLASHIKVTGTDPLRYRIAERFFCLHIARD